MVQASVPFTSAERDGAVSGPLATSQNGTAGFSSNGLHGLSGHLPLK